MPRTPGEALRKVTLNLYDSDCYAMAKLYGWGWSEVVRELVRKHISYQTFTMEDQPQTVGDLDEHQR